MDKIARLFRIIRQSGGIIQAAYKLWRFDTLKEGKYVGMDSFGNKFYENNYYQLSRNRWVEYNHATRWDYDASQITPEWYGWLHYKTDCKPTEDLVKRNLAKSDQACRWLLPHTENLSATRLGYIPYTTVPPFIEVWNGKTTPMPCAKGTSAIESAHQCSPHFK